MAWNTVFRMCLLTYAICVCAPDMLAQVPLKQDILREVAINSRKIKVDTSLNPVQVLTEKQMERTNSFSVADAVRHFSGVQLKDYGGIGGLKTINVRSLGSQHTGVFYNGVELGNAQNGQVDLGKFSLENIEQIELYNGQANSELLPARAYSLANSLFIHTKQPELSENQKYAVKTSFKTGSFGLINPSFIWQQKIKSNISANLSAELQSADGRYKFDHTNGDFDTVITRTNTDLNAFRLETGFYGVNKDSSSIWNLQTYLYTSDRGLPKIIVENVFTSKQRLNDNDFFMQASFKKYVGNRYRFQLRGKYSYHFNRYSDPEWLGSNKINNWYKQNELYFSFANQFSLTPVITVSLAADLIQSNMDAKIDLSPTAFPEPSRLTGLMALKTSLNLKGLDLEGSILSTTVAESVKYGTSANNKQAYSPSFSAAWKPFERMNLQLSGYYKRSFRLPTFNDQYYTLIGNTALKPEYATQYNWGLNYVKGFSGRLSFVSLGLNAYQNRIQDKIVAIPTNNLFLWTMSNLDKVCIKGLETRLSTELKLSQSSSLIASLNYTYQQALEMTPGNYYKKPVPYAPVHSGAATLGFTHNNLNINYNYLYTAERYGLRTIDKFSYMQPWYTHDISAFYDLNYRKARYKIGAEVSNLFDLTYDVVHHYPMPGRSFRITLKYALSN